MGNQVQLTNKCRFPLGLPALLILVLYPSMVLSQSQMTTGVIEGTVYDQDRGVVPGTLVEFKHLGIGIFRRVRANDTGRYTAIQLPVGNYEITARKSGFATLKRTGIRLAVGQTEQVDLLLKVSPTETTIEITDVAPSLELSRHEHSTLIDVTALSNLPLNGRRFLDLALLAAMVYQEKERGQLSLSGARGINGSISIDGADFNQPFFGGQRGGERSPFAYLVSQEAIQEFRVVHGNFPAEFGGSSGGLINVVTKSGSTDYHGSAFYYLRHREFAVRDILGEDRAPTRQQFGFGLGGPVVREKTFFYTVYDQQNESQPLTVRFNRQVGLPPEILDKEGTFKSTNDVNTYLFKIDSQISLSHTLSVRYNYSRNYAKNGTQVGVTNSALENNGTEGNQTHGIVANLNSLFGQNVFNELRAQFSHEARPRVNNGEDSSFVSTAGPEIRIGDCCTLGGLSPLPTQAHDYHGQASDNISLLKGTHNFKFGFDYGRTLVDQTFRGNWRGLYFFYTTTNYLRALRGEINSLTGQPYSADLFRVFFGEGRFNASVNQYAAFLQDTFRPSARVSVNLGLRYEASLLPQPSQPNPLLPQTARVPSDRQMWQPRVGFSWNIFGNGKTVFRLGGGFFHARTPLLLLNQAFNSNGNPNVGVTFNLFSRLIDAVQRVHPEFVFPFVPDTSKAGNASYFLGAGVQGIRPDASFFEPNFRNPRSLQYMVGVERLVGSDLAVSLDYLHANTVFLERIRDVNLPAPVFQLDNSLPPVPRPRFDLTSRPNPRFGILRQQESSARANYDAVTLTITHKASKRLQFSSNYTLAYNRDDDSNERNFLGITYENAFDLRPEYRWSRDDIRHRWAFSGLCDLPWRLQLGSIIEWRTNFPFSAFTGIDSNGDGQLTDKPIINGVPLLRNSFRQPNSFSHDLRLTKILRLTETHHLSWILDIFNVWNSNNFLFTTSINEQGSSTALGSLWGRGQAPLPTFRTLRLPDGSINRGGIFTAFPFQVQLAVKYTF